MNLRRGKLYLTLHAGVHFLQHIEKFQSIVSIKRKKKENSDKGNRRKILIKGRKMAMHDAMFSF